MMPPSPMRLGMIGFGRIVELIHLPVVKRLKGIEVAGVYDITPERLRLAERRGFHTYTDLDELLSTPLDAVLVATPHQSHYSIAALALRAGKHVILEKPVTLTSEEAIQLKQLAQSSGKVITVFHNRRYDSDFELVKQVIAGGELGPLLSVSRRHHSFGSGAPFGVKSFYPNWRNEAYYGGGALLDWGVHLIDQLLQLQAGKFRRITATLQNMRWLQGDVEDYVQATICTDQDIMVSLDINFGSYANTPMWVVGGEAGTLEVISDREATIYLKDSKPRTIELKPSLLDGPCTIYASFLAHLQEGKPLAITIDEAVETMRVVDAIRQSAAQRKEVLYGDYVLSPSS
ncbi:Gfo/Idh/MocA family protein [Paenibacillus hexagrammi]|uniref:Gfo/Idh/MocA family oxidoreductase n=1 Tax=Paenibacillus hexagrammi TaxID=2908839 RepID=A0ABY3SG08_9BACL|nr:Gfo/Idh/MocA family oxidoreductase [Paenibacillus sp. YPD9-1]UJF31872.1 Gfo/Idh/MocA family oxidoreductase [Paenibacillus sp. YPD9-1]